jgi:hypothetical protein
MALVLLLTLAWVVVWTSKRADISEHIQGLTCLRIGPSGGADGRCGGYWDDYPDGFHWLREDGTWSN